MVHLLTLPFPFQTSSRLGVACFLQSSDYHSSCQYFGYSDWQDGSRDKFRAGNWWMWELFIGDMREVVAPSLEDDWHVNEELMVCVLDMDNNGGIVTRVGKAIDQHIQLVTARFAADLRLLYCWKLVARHDWNQVL